MYQYAKEKLTYQLEEKENEKSKKEKKINEIEMKLEKITRYQDIHFRYWHELRIDIVLILISTIAAAVSIGAIIKKADIVVNLLGIVLAGCSVGCLSMFIKDLSTLNSYKKTIKSLEQEGIKELEEQELELENELTKVAHQNRNVTKEIEEICDILDKIHFSEIIAVNDIFYQANTKEEYEEMLKTQVETEDLEENQNSEITLSLTRK